jgi:hypothetical protein
MEDGATTLDEMVNDPGTYGEFYFNINENEFIKNIEIIENNSIIMLMGHGNVVLDHHEFYLNVDCSARAVPVPATVDSSKSKLRSSSQQQGWINDHIPRTVNSTNLLLQISKENKNKTFLFIFNSCMANIVLDDIKKHKDKENNLLIIVPSQCKKIDNQEIYNLTCCNPLTGRGKLEYLNDLTNKFTFRNYTSTPDDDIYIDLDSCRESNIFCQSPLEIKKDKLEKESQQLSDLEPFDSELYSKLIGKLETIEAEIKKEQIPIKNKCSAAVIYGDDDDDDDDDESYYSDGGKRTKKQKRKKKKTKKKTKIQKKIKTKNKNKKKKKKKTKKKIKKKSKNM